MKGIDFRNMDHFQASSEILRKAVETGLVDWTWGDPEHEGIISPQTIEYADELFQSTGAHNTGDLENAGVSPKSIHFRTNTRGRQVHPDELAPHRAWGVELARFIVPDGYIGIIKGLEQYLATVWGIPGGTDAFVYSQNSRWGVPGPWHAVAPPGIPSSDLGTWHFRLHNLSRTTPIWWNALGIVQLPDLPYTDFPNDEQLWFPAGSASSQNLHLIVPAGRMLRVIYVTPEQNARFEVACKLRGFIQSDRTLESAYNARTNW